MTRPTIHEIQAATCAHFRITLEQLLCHDRRREWARPRQIAMYLCHVLCERPITTIARMFERDRATVHHAIRTIRAMSASDDKMCDDLASVHLGAAGMARKRGGQRDDALAESRIAV